MTIVFFYLFLSVHMVKPYIKPILINQNMVDSHHRLTLVELLTQLLTSAGMHALKLKKGLSDLNRQNHTWVLSRMRVEILRWPKMGEELILETWPKGVERLFGIRDFMVYDKLKNPVVKARTYWLVIDLKTRRPIDIRNEMHELNIQDKSAISQKLNKLSDFQNIDYQGHREVLPSDIDMNHHVTSVCYTKWILKVLPEDVFRNMILRSYEVNHLSEVFMGQSVRIELGGDHSQSVSGRILHSQTGKVAFRAKMDFEAK